MGAIARASANNITTAGVFTADAITNASVTGITVLAGISDGLTLISSQTADNSASLSFTSGLDSTYKAYKFVFVNMHPRTDSVNFEFNFSTDSGSNYNVTKTTTYFTSLHAEDDNETGLAYKTNLDLAQSTAFQPLADRVGNGADESVSGSLTLFNPSSTVYVKHFLSDTNAYLFANYSNNDRSAGYGNTTSAINAIQFKMASGNMDGTIYLYGIK
jgi:hypothetical protein